MADQLAELFDQRYRIRVKGYAGFVPNACHQEVGQLFELQTDTFSRLAQSCNQSTHTVELPMRIGYLILTHNTPNHFSRLVHALYDEHAHIYTHIDQKSDILAFQYGRRSIREG